ncbi:hypothetical protein VC4260B_18090 [Vibrio cholerae 4260B]|uniref:Uncharacterized protein kp13 n=2 Tax=root TaxID=1 RepID=A9ZT16_9CAUD|nr:hypothetical protein KP13 [Vibrio phage Kappa]ABQ18769.1 hypothetical protein VC0395_1068 [Vibrio cholerae O395]APF80461.1 hypothetical protein ASZ85_02970 [Vibrio cholerae]EAZ75198.1 hypothetical protein A5C_A0254 [Vibrio cholerae NCTC 8457]ELP49949.1 hypothetical protein VC4260B_18090 [Vibrio cholerae 4260B]ACP11043.1 hypothetical protein VC395_A0200 [Vibrio cholerae O395]
MRGIMRPPSGFLAWRLAFRNAGKWCHSLSLGLGSKGKG